MNTKTCIAILSSIALSVSPASAKDHTKEVAKAGGAATAGAVVGGVTFAYTGSIGVALGGTAVSIGAAPIIAAGAVLGIAGYGIYRIFK
jgi:hypothetical protein